MAKVLLHQFCGNRNRVIFTLQDHSCFAHPDRFANERLQGLADWHFKYVVFEFNFVVRRLLGKLEPELPLADVSVLNGLLPPRRRTYPKPALDKPKESSNCNALTRRWLGLFVASELRFQQGLFPGGSQGDTVLGHVFQLKNELKVRRLKQFSVALGGCFQRFRVSNPSNKPLKGRIAWLPGRQTARHHRKASGNDVSASHASLHVPRQ